MDIRIKQVNSKSELKAFVRYPHRLYRDEPNFVPQLNVSVKWMLGKKNPFMQHAEVKLFLAYKGKEVQGRIAAIHNRVHLKIHEDQTGFFGFFDAINDREVAKALFDVAAAWLREKGIKRMIGPASLTTNDSVGFLSQGYDLPPMINMPYNYAYYNQLCTGLGFRKEIGLSSYAVDGEAILRKYPASYERAQRRMEAEAIRIRPVSMRHFQTDMMQLRNVYNSCNRDNWGFMPLNEAEFMEMAKDLKRILPPDLAQFAEYRGRIIGFVIAAPNLNEALRHVKNGRLTALNIARLLWYRRRVKTGRILILGLLEGFQNKGIDLILYQRIKEMLNKHGIYKAEACYVFESNKRMNGILSKISDGIVKRYSIYGKAI